MNIALLFVLAATAAVVFATTGVWLGRHFMRGRVDKGHHEVLATLFQTGGTLHAVFLAFLVVAVWESYNAAHANVADEASALTTLYRESAGMESGMGKELRRLIRDYTDAVVRDEWRIQAETGGASPKARAAGLDMYRLFAREKPATKQSDSAIDEAALAIISQIQSDRNRRTLAAEASLPPIMWFAAIGSGAIVLSMSFFLFMEQAAPQMIVTSIMTSTVALLLCIAFVLSHPFAGPMALNPEPFKHAIEVYDSVDATP
ncbi:MAG TPA: hypothetical protein VL574_11665 [Stellaceae bacterium]|nr:hypothetical protein [Stellaceae bacterium]